MINSNKRRDSGFSLIELLTAIVIFSLVMGMGAFLLISLSDNSKDKISEVTINSIKHSSINYVSEKGNTISWIDAGEDKTLDEEYICVSVRSLVDYGYFKKDIFDDNKNLEQTDFVRLTRNKTTKSIISNDFGDDINDFCAATVAYYPTCNTVTYNGNPQKLITYYDSSKMALTNTDTMKVNAGTYKYKFLLTGDGAFSWEDGTINEYELTCSINKYTCSIDLENKEIRYDGNEHKYSVNDVKIRGVGNKFLTNVDNNDIVIDYYKDKDYVTNVTSIKDVSEYYVKVDVDLDNYNYSKKDVILDIYEPIIITLNNQNAKSEVQLKYMNGMIMVFI